MKNKIKYILITLLFLIIPIMLVGCNKQIFDIEYTFNKAYVKIGEEWVDLKIDKWCDYEGEQIQLVLEDGTVMIVSSNNCILYNGELPIAK